MKTNITTKFIYELARTKDPTIFIGVARILNVNLLSEQKDSDGHFVPRDFELVFEDILDNYSKAKYKRQKELLSILRQANQGVAQDLAKGEI